MAAVPAAVAPFRAVRGHSLIGAIGAPSSALTPLLSNRGRAAADGTSGGSGDGGGGGFCNLIGRIFLPIATSDALGNSRLRSC